MYIPMSVHPQPSASSLPLAFSSLGQEVERLAQYFDTNGDGTINFDEMLYHLRPPMSDSRLALIDQAFRKIDVTGDGVVTVEDLAHSYDPRHHPKYMSGEWDAEKVFLQFLRSFDSPANPDGVVTKQEFESYYCTYTMTPSPSPRKT